MRRHDKKPDRDTNPAVEAARKAARAVDARIAVACSPGHATDLLLRRGRLERSRRSWRRAKISHRRRHTGTLPDADTSRDTLGTPFRASMAAVPAYWTAVRGRPRAHRRG